MLLIILILAVIFFIFAIFFIWIHTAPRNCHGSDALIILGYKVEGDHMNYFLEERLSAALELLRDHRFEKVIVTGGIVGASSRSEAEIMKDFLLRHGVEPDRILLEMESKDTIDNLVNCKKIMDREKLRTCLIISNSFHLRRIKLIADTVGVSPGYYARRSFHSLLKQGVRTYNELRTFIITIRLLKQKERGYE
ncbi:YdcF family protein [Paenibacillus alkaliterrae]|uniref:YdcF family protein n=1 Tax=Paenibacillus alkaliterrae TaxID=320909 RepID=UPI001F286607|nr:YdcF family protein [Paenibacillus alkaliterrae]MCF2941319.1 YdcF family protein [Paenibacillus alkaliterrae]